MRSLLSHFKTKDELTAYLANKALLHAQRVGKKLIVSCRNEARSSDGSDVRELQSTQEEEDTKSILHFLYASCHSTTLHIYSPDTDVLSFHCGGRNVSQKTLGLPQDVVQLED